jgi:hypothetical protein
MSATGHAGTVATRASLAPGQRRQLVFITLGAIALFVALRALPTGTNLSHMDFRVDAKNANAIEFCDPLNPQFIPVVAVRSPVTMTIATLEPAIAGKEVQATIVLKTGSGKPVAPDDLLVTHTRKLHVLVADPSLTDYQHVHPEPSDKPGKWVFAFTPRASGTYRVFGDFTPMATGRGLYASVDLNVAGAVGQVSDLTTRAGEATRKTSQVKDLTYSTVEREGIAFSLTTTTPPRAGQPIDLSFTMSRRDGGAVALEPVMGAFAHLVAFDEARSGFAHLHPSEADLLKKPDAMRPVLNFKLTIPRAGRYVIWAQVNLGGSEVFVPFEFPVEA